VETDSHNATPRQGSRPDSERRPVRRSAIVPRPWPWTARPDFLRSGAAGEPGCLHHPERGGTGGHDDRPRVRPSILIRATSIGSAQTKGSHPFAPASHAHPNSSSP